MGNSLKIVDIFFITPIQKQFHRRDSEYAEK
jgi:hypothetical protein